MKLSTKGENYIKNREGLRLKAYKCTSGKWTIGYGHTGVEVQEGSIINVAKAEALFKLDVSAFVKTVNACIKVNLTQYEFDALVSLCYNIGSTSFMYSTLVKRLNNPLIPKSIASKQFLVWNKVVKNGVVVTEEGLVSRRKKELQLFTKGVY